MDEGLLGYVLGRPRPERDKGYIGSSLPSFPVSPQAIAHYEQSADYYKGEESNRYPGPKPLLLSSQSLVSLQLSTTNFLLSLPHTAQPTSVY